MVEGVGRDGAERDEAGGTGPVTVAVSAGVGVSTGVGMVVSAGVGVVVLDAVGVAI